MSSKRTAAIAGVAAAAAAALVAYVALRRAPVGECVRLLGPLDRIEAATHLALRAGEPREAHGECSLEVWAADRRAAIANPVVIVDAKHGRHYEHLRAQLAARGFASSEPVAFGGAK